MALPTNPPFYFRYFEGDEDISMHARLSRHVRPGNMQQAATVTQSHRLRLYELWMTQDDKWLGFSVAIGERRRYVHDL